MIIGCIGDDFTGSSDIANTLAKGGMRVTQYVGVPNQPAKQDVQAGAVSLKIRTIPVEEAVRQSVEAAKWLLAQGCRQLFYKYCSTFDSTPEGNIGPVTEALAELTGEQRVVMCPAFPTAGRTVYQGHLFVFDTLLSESSMKDHPLTPMTDPDLRRWLQLQTDFKVGHVSARHVFAGQEGWQVFTSVNPDSGEVTHHPFPPLINDFVNDNRVLKDEMVHKLFFLFHFQMFVSTDLY